MSQRLSKTPCEHFELLISSSIDKEISYQEQIQLAEHLLHCSDCESRQKNFQIMNGFVGKLGKLDEHDTELVQQTRPSIRTGVDVTAPGVVGVHSVRWKRGWLAACMLASAALIGIVMINVVGETTTAKPNTDIIGPMVSLSSINSKRKKDQEFLRESLEFDLRTLKLQLYALNDTSDETETREVLGRINRLMEKIDQAKIN